MIETFLFDRADESLGIGIEIRTSRRQLQRVHACASEDALELLCVQGVPVMDQVLFACEKVDSGSRPLARSMFLTVVSPILYPR